MDILSPSQILSCLQEGSREDMLQAAARMGALWAAEICETMSKETKHRADDDFKRDGGGSWDSHRANGMSDCADAIRAEVGEK